MVAMRWHGICYRETQCRQVSGREEGRLAQLQQTVARPIDIEGAGLHSGSNTRLRIAPAGPGDGITFLRHDRGGLRIPATYPFLRNSSYATSLGNEAGEISTVEHLLSALQGLGIDNADVEVHGPEVPILDGSARPFVEAILAAGSRTLSAPRRFLTLERPISIKQGDRAILALPSNELRITYAIDFPHPAIGYQSVSACMEKDLFISAIAPARTFCLLRDVDTMRRAGLARGGSLDNAVVVDDDGVMNESLRFPDEFVRHKVLDLVGDLALLGSSLRAHVIVFKGGHRTHAELVGTLLASRAAWTLGTSDDHLPKEHLARFAHLTEQLVPVQAAIGV